MARMLKADVIAYTNELIERYAYDCMKSHYHEAEGDLVKSRMYQDMSDGIMTSLIIFSGFSGQSAEALRRRAKDEAGKLMTDRMKEGRWPRRTIG
jgi:hypothetical protein